MKTRYTLSTLTAGGFIAASVMVVSGCAVFVEKPRPVSATLTFEVCGETKWTQRVIYTYPPEED